MVDPVLSFSLCYIGVNIIPVSWANDKLNSALPQGVSKSPINVIAKTMTLSSVYKRQRIDRDIVWDEWFLRSQNGASDLEQLDLNVVEH